MTMQTSTILDIFAPVAVFLGLVGLSFCCLVYYICCRSEQNRRFDQQALAENARRQLNDLQLDIEAQQPLGQAETMLLPKRRYRKTTGSRPADESCAICVDDFKKGDTLRVLPCSHQFHVECIDEWLINHSDLCPLCKNQVPRKRRYGTV